MPRVIKCIDTESRTEAAGSGGGRNGRLLSNGQSFNFTGWKLLRGRRVVMGAQQCECTECHWTVSLKMVHCMLCVLPQFVKMEGEIPGWCGSIGWASPCKPKGRRLDSQSGHVPRLWVWPWLGCLQKATSQCFSLTSMFLSLSFSLPVPFSEINGHVLG